MTLRSLSPIKFLSSLIYGVALVYSGIVSWNPEVARSSIDVSCHYCDLLIHGVCVCEIIHPDPSRTICKITLLYISVYVHVEY